MERDLSATAHGIEPSRSVPVLEIRETNSPDEALRDRDGMVAALRRDIAPQLVRHCVIFARTPAGEDEPIRPAHVVGCGTLIQVSAGDGHVHYGVLTCGHVLGAFERPVTSTRYGSLTLVTMSNTYAGRSPPSGMEIGYCKEVAVTAGARDHAIAGPDLGWLHLSSEQARALQYAGNSGAVFHNTTLGLRSLGALRAGTRSKGLPVSDEMVGNDMFVATGRTREIQERSGGRRYCIGMTEVALQGVSAMDGWQYADFLINRDGVNSQAYDDGTGLLSTRKGLSGGAIWHLWRKDASSKVVSRMLRGVAFHETPRQAGGAMHVRAHFELSVQRLLHRAGVAPPDTMREADIKAALEHLQALGPAGFDSYAARNEH